tara:strand:+ start:66 stop:398 length:333 start_codon:yes stop_codon:yes gene_type:complete
VKLAKCGGRIMAITSAFQADDTGSIPVRRSKKNTLKGAFFCLKLYLPLQGLFSLIPPGHRAKIEIGDQTLSPESAASSFNCFGLAVALIATKDAPITTDIIDFFNKLFIS